MRQRELGFLAVGLLIGLLISGALFSSGALSGLLSGTVGNSTPPDARYYQVDLATARSWMLETSDVTATETVEGSDTLAGSIDQIEALPSAENFRQGLRDAESAIDTFLTQSYEMIAGTDVPAQTAGLDQEEILACLGMDDDPYNVEGPVFYLYVKVPSERASVLPATWTPLDAPKNNDLYWQLLSCQPG